MKLKGIVLAGGTASRLYPLTAVSNKHLLPVGKIPMIYWPIARLLEADVRDILVVTSCDHIGHIVGLLGSGSDIGAEFTYRVQDKAGGIAQALGLAEDFVDECCVVILGDNIYAGTIADKIKSFDGIGSKIFLKEVPDPGRYGVAELSVCGDRVIGIEEKPREPRTNLAVTGCYMYDYSVFEVIKTLKPSGRGEIEITDVNNYYISEGRMKCAEIVDEWTDAGTFDSLQHAGVLVHDLPIPEVVSAIMTK